MGPRAPRHPRDWEKFCFWNKKNIWFSAQSSQAQRCSLPTWTPKSSLQTSSNCRTSANLGIVSWTYPRDNLITILMPFDHIFENGWYNVSFKLKQVTPWYHAKKNRSPLPSSYVTGSKVAIRGIGHPTLNRESLYLKKTYQCSWVDDHALLWRESHRSLDQTSHGFVPIVGCVMGCHLGWVFLLVSQKAQFFSGNSRGPKPNSVSSLGGFFVGKNLNGKLLRFKMLKAS